MILYAIIVCSGISAAVLVRSKSAREHLRRAWKTLKDSETHKHEQVLICFGIVLIASGAVIPGPLDEIIGAVIIARIVKRVTERKENPK